VVSGGSSPTLCLYRSKDRRKWVALDQRIPPVSFGRWKVKESSSAKQLIRPFSMFAIENLDPPSHVFGCAVPDTQRELQSF